MSDLAINVRQIASYPNRTAPIGTDTLLCQIGGVGGPYNSLTINGLASAFATQGQISVGLPLPADALNTGIIATGLTTPVGCTAGWNWYKNTAGTGTGNSYLASGPALQECFSAAGVLTFNVAVAGTAGAAIPSWTTILTMASSGLITQPTGASIALGRNASATNEAVTLSQMNAAVANTVTSFNGRQGVVTLTTTDITGAGGAPIASPNFTGAPNAPTPTATDNSTLIATTAFVHNAVAAAVTSFNGRTGAIVLTTADITGAGGAPIASPALTGTPTAPTPAPGNNTTNIATTAFVSAAVAAAVISFNGRTGAVTLLIGDITGAGGAPLASPAFSGTPNAPTANAGTSTSQLATTAFVMAAVQSAVTGVTSWNTRTGAVTMTATDINNAGGALLNSPALTGTPTAPTAPNGTTSTQLATTAFVMNEVAAVGAGVTTWNTRTGNVVMSTADITGAGGAPIASPNFSGIPIAATAAPGTNTTQLATTAFVAAAVAAGVVSFNGRTGSVTLNNNDISAAGGLANPNAAMTGTPTAPTAIPGTNTTQIASTAFVTAAVAAFTSIVVSATAPTNPQPGAGWFNLNVGQLYIYSAGVWVIAVNPPVPNLTGYAQLSGATFTGPITAPTISGPTVINGNVGLNFALPANVAAPSAGGAHIFGWVADFQNYGLNAYYDGTNWRRSTGSNAPFVIVEAAATLFALQGAAVGAVNSVATMANLFTIDAVTSNAALGGQLNVAGNVGLNFTLPSDAQNAGQIFGGTADFQNYALNAYVDNGGNWRRSNATYTPAALSADTTGANFLTAPVGAVDSVITWAYPLKVTANGISYSAPSLIGFGNYFAFGYDTTSNNQIAGFRVMVNGTVTPPMFAVRGYSQAGSYFGVMGLGLAGSQTQIACWGEGSTAVQWSCAASDRQLKHNLAPPNLDALATVNAITVYGCDYVHPNAMDGHRERWDFTLVADEVEARLPFAYLPAPEGGFATLHPLHLIATLWKAVQQLSAEITALKGAHA